VVELHNLSPAPGSRKNRKRLGRGPGSGTGKTSGKGQKGQKARAGASVPAGFEGGQMPLQRRIPKFGFKPISRVEYQVVNIGALNGMTDAEITPELLAQARLIRSRKDPVKILGNGELERAVRVAAHAFSGSAKRKIEAAGGSVVALDR
jgi:large subunit ribosomal protein L15